MAHYRLSRADSVGSEGQLNADAKDDRTALLDFGRQLGDVTLSLNCDAAPDYLMQSRTNDEVDFANSEKVGVCLVRPQG